MLNQAVVKHFRTFQRRYVVDHHSFLSQPAKERKSSPIRALQPLLKTPGLISLGGGLPAPNLFPIASVSFKLKDGFELILAEKQLDEALQYSPSYGLEGLVSALKTHQNRIHSPLYTDWEILVTNGSQDALSKAFLTLLNPGDSILTEDPTYSGALAYLHPHGVNCIGVPIDGQGIIPEKLEDILERFSHKNPSLRHPKVLYTIPTGQNPSGATLTNQRRKAIYDIACRYNLIILEDDPYWYLQLFPPISPPRQPNNNTSIPNKELEPIKSFFSLDTDHRVIRFDTFSKIISSGLRIGWATGPKTIIENMQLNQQATSLHPSGLSQQTVFKLLEKWGAKGFDDHVAKVRLYYSWKRDVFLESVKRHLDGLVTWTPPSAGMFGWLRINGVEDTEELIKTRALEAKVLMLPGKVFSPNSDGNDFFGGKSITSAHVRASFSTATPEEIDIALARFAELIRKEKN